MRSQPQPSIAMLFRRAYYIVKPVIPRWVQIQLRRYAARCKLGKYRHIWPIDEKAAKPPEKWQGWPEGKRFALVVTHDVESEKGLKRCRSLAEMEKKLGFCSSFNFTAEGYRVSQELRDHLTSKGFEVGIHGLIHDGKLYNSRASFEKQAKRINRYLQEWGSVGFRSPSMQNNLDWIHDLNIEYDASTFDTDPFEPQPEGMGTIFPFRVSQNGSTSKGYIELPYTLPQDFTLFILLSRNNIDIWKNKLDWIAEHGGMALLITHPDYMNFNNTKLGIEEYSAEHYQQLLEYIKSKYDGQYWHVLPKDMARFWKERH